VDTYKGERSTSADVVPGRDDQSVTNRTGIMGIKCWRTTVKLRHSGLTPHGSGITSEIVSRVSAGQHLPKPETEDNGDYQRRFFASYNFIGTQSHIWKYDAYITINIRVRCAATVSSEAIPWGTSYLGTKGIGSPSTQSTVISAVSRVNPSPAYFLSQYAFITAAVP